MGADVNAILRRDDSTRSVVELLEKLNDIPRFGFESQAWTWGWVGSTDPPFDQWLAACIESGHVRFDGPYGTTLYVTTSAAVAEYSCEWPYFFESSDPYPQIRALNTQLGSFFGSNVTMIMPGDILPYGDIIDGVVTAKMSFEEARQALYNHSAPQLDWDHTMIKMSNAGGEATIYEIVGWYEEYQTPT